MKRLVCSAALPVDVPAKEANEAYEAYTFSQNETSETTKRLSETFPELTTGSLDEPLRLTNGSEFALYREMDPGFGFFELNWFQSHDLLSLDPYGIANQEVGELFPDSYQRTEHYWIETEDDQFHLFCDGAINDAEFQMIQHQFLDEEDTVEENEYAYS
jgi:hypothetical protein